MSLHISTDSQHQRNERAYASQNPYSIAKLVVNGRKAKTKIVQFVAIFHLSKHSKPMTNFEHMKVLFDFLKIHHTSRKHLINWGMSTAMHNVILKHNMLLVQQARFISINCDKVTNLDNYSWIYVHVYIVENWRKVPIILNLERIVNGGTSNNLTFVIIHSLVVFCDNTNKVVCFRVNNVIIFQGLKIV
jgi:hypothetical protein